MDENLRDYVKPGTKTSQYIKFYIALLALRNNMCDIPNTLVLDGGGGLYRIDRPYRSKLNGVEYNPLTGEHGLLSSINAVQFDKLFECYLTTDTKTPPPLENYVEECVGTPYGFKLSTILENIGDESLLVPYKEVTKADLQVPIGNSPPGKKVDTDTNLRIDNGWTGIAHLFITQKAFRVKKRGGEYILFTFDIKNVGDFLAQKVLFKDVLPHGLTLCYPEIYFSYNGGKVEKFDSDNYRVFGRELFIRLTNLDVGEMASLSILTKVVSDDYKEDVNVGVISYVGYHVIVNQTSSTDTSSGHDALSYATQPQKTPEIHPYAGPDINYITMVLQGISNPKSLYKTLKKGGSL